MSLIIRSVFTIHFSHKPFYDNQRPWQKIRTQVSIGTAIQSPFTFYCNESDWNSSHSYQFWNKNFTAATGVNNTATIKTIYSPSPSGYVEPKTAAFTGFTSTGGNVVNANQFNVNGAWDKGLNFYTNGWKTGGTIFLAALGFRDIYLNRPTANGEIGGANDSGLYWTAGARTTTFGRFFYFYTGGLYPDNGDYRSAGFTCRSVME